MKNKKVYEWSVEYTDKQGDIIDIQHANTFRELINCTADFKGLSPVFVLVLNEGNDNQGLNFRAWANVKNKKLPENFSNEYGEEYPNIKVPKKFINEIKSGFNLND